MIKHKEKLNGVLTKISNLDPNDIDFLLEKKSFNLEKSLYEDLYSRNIREIELLKLPLFNCQDYTDPDLINMIENYSPEIEKRLTKYNAVSVFNKCKKIFL